MDLTEWLQQTCVSRIIIYLNSLNKYLLVGAKAHDRVMKKYLEINRIDLNICGFVQSS